MAGAEPGDVLKVEIQEFAHEGWGWTCIYPGFGLLPDDFGNYMGLFIWKVGKDGRAELKPGIRIPIEPFMGIMGVAPKEDGAHSTMPPRRTGGNLDIRHLCKGSVAYFPVDVPGALFSVGDGHLAQGDGGKFAVWPSRHRSPSPLGSQSKKAVASQAYNLRLAHRQRAKLTAWAIMPQRQPARTWLRV